MINDLGFVDKLNIDDEHEEEQKVDIQYEEPKFNNDQLVDAKDDYKYLRSKMRFLMASGEFILNKSLQSLLNDTSPRQVEAASLILRNVVKISGEILSLHEKTKSLSKTESPKNGSDTDEGIKTSLVDIIKQIQVDNKQ